MSDILYSSSVETWEMEFTDPDATFSATITAVDLQFIRYSGLSAHAGGVTNA